MIMGSISKLRRFRSILGINYTSIFLTPFRFISPNHYGGNELFQTARLARVLATPDSAPYRKNRDSRGGWKSWAE